MAQCQPRVCARCWAWAAELDAGRTSRIVLVFGEGTITSDGSGRPRADIPHKTSNARTFRHNNLVVLPQPTDAVHSSHPQLAQWVAVGDPTLVGRLATARVLLGRNADPHLTERRCVVAFTAASPDQPRAEAVKEVRFIVT